MHPDAMQHKASLWEGEFANSRHITDVYWEGDISQEELVEVADQISLDWQTIDLELDASHPRYGHVYRLHRSGSGAAEAARAAAIARAEDELAGQFVWVHCCQHVYDLKGEFEDASGRAYRQVFSTVMFCVEFVSFDDIAEHCNENLGEGAWDAYELFLDDELPQPVAVCD